MYCCDHLRVELRVDLTQLLAAELLQDTQNYGHALVTQSHHLCLEYSVNSLQCQGFQLRVSVDRGCYLPVGLDDLWRKSPLLVGSDNLLGLLGLVDLVCHTLLRVW